MFASLDEVYGHEFSQTQNAPNVPNLPNAPNVPNAPRWSGESRVRANLGGAGPVELQVQNPNPFTNQHAYRERERESRESRGSPLDGSQSKELEPTSACHYIWHHVRNCSVCQQQWIPRHQASAATQAAQAAQAQAAQAQAAQTANAQSQSEPRKSRNDQSFWQTNWFWILLVLVVAFVIGVEFMRWFSQVWPSSHMPQLAHMPQMAPMAPMAPMMAPHYYPFPNSHYS